MLRNMTIGKKLLWGFGSALALTLGLGIIALEGIGKLAEANSETVKRSAQKRFLSSSINAAATSVLAAERGVLLRAYMRDRPTMEQYHQDVQDISARARKLVEEFDALNPSGDERQLR